ncbi:MAG TPA: hypothetical protein ENI26_09670, partial [Methylophaga aminisulfidivorans]|nr:hypothetical protein [Methylophaga aminisulfidivorans]
MSFQLLSAGNDYSQFIASRLRQLKHVWRLNQPQVLEFSIASEDKTFSAFGVPARDDTVALHTDKFGNNTFKGFINSTPKARVLGYNTTAPIFVYDFTSISEEYQLNILSARLSVVPNLTGRKSGDIIKVMTEFLLSGIFDVTNVDDGEFQPDFEIKSGEIWSDVVKRLAENDGFHYWVLDGKIFYKPLGDAPFGVSYDLNTDPAVTGWNVSLMNPNPVASPIKNDIIVVGGDAPKGFGKAHFIGDGFEGNFRLQSPMFGFEETKILDDSWVNGSVNDSVWELVDPTSAVQVGVPNLQIIGGNGLGATYLRLHRALELGGQLRLIHGELQFTAASDGRIGGLYKNFTGLTDADLVAGFKLSKNAAQTDIQAMVDGATAGSTLTTQTDHTYVLITRILGPGPFVFLRRSASKNSTTGFGGFGPTLAANVIFEVWDFDIVASQDLLDPVITRIHEA